jgi:hypothetical protein
VIALGAGRDVTGVGHQALLQRRVIAEEFRRKRHLSTLSHAAPTGIRGTDTDSEK